MSNRQIIVDTGPLVAFIAEKEPRHDWAHEQFKSLPAPFFTCEAVLTETFHFLSRGRNGARRFFDFLSTGLLMIDFSVRSEIPSLERLARKYQDVPMSFADACLVRMADARPSASVLTLDSDFKIYRRSDRQAIKVIMPVS